MMTGEDPGFFFRRGCTRLLLYFNTNKPHNFFFLQNISCIRKPQIISGGGGHPLHPPPRCAPEEQTARHKTRINSMDSCYKLREVLQARECNKQGRKISDICLKQGQGIRGRAAPPHPGLYRVPPPPPKGAIDHR